MAMMAEINALSAALEDPKRPVMAVVGGAKVSTKIEVLTNLAQRMDMIVVGGGMANTFLFADGVDVGKSLCEPDFVQTVKEIAEKAKISGCEIVLPVDVVVADSLAEGVETSVCGVDEIPPDALALDQGPASVAMLKDKLKEVQTILWNGPLGAFEITPFGTATFALAQAAATRSAHLTWRGPRTSSPISRRQAVPSLSGLRASNCPGLSFLRVTLTRSSQRWLDDVQGNHHRALDPSG
jgi:phosphoglycerate kinase